MSVLLHPLTGRRAPGVEWRRCPSSSSTADDREWFGRCRRAWDLGARGPAGTWWPAAARLEPDGEPGAWRSAARWRCTTSPACGPGTGRSSSRSCVAAYERAGGPADGRRLLEEFRRWAAGGRPVHAPAGRGRHRRPRPRPGAPRHPPGHAPTGDAVRYRDRIDLVLVDDDDRCWLGEHRVVDEFADRRRAAARRARLLTACWAWEEIELATTIAGVQYTELRLDPPACRRTVGAAVATSRRRGAARRLGASRAGRCSTPTSASSPTPSWVHCARCPFRAPVHRDEPGRRRRRRCSPALRRARPRRARGGPPRGHQLGHGPRRRATRFRGACVSA